MSSASESGAWTVSPDCVPEGLARGRLTGHVSRARGSEHCRRSVGLLAAVCLLLLPSCRDAKPTSAGEEAPAGRQKTTEIDDALSGPVRDAVELAIVLYARRGGLTNPFTLPPETEERLFQYKASYEMSTDGIFSTPVAHGTKLMIPSGGMLRCVYQGELEFTVTFTGGTVGVVDNEIYVEEGTRVSVDADSYVFRGGRWQEHE
jgi:hypothetical protein